MKLYHFTSIAHLPDIMRTGTLQLCESNVSPKRRMAGPRVVWLTKNPNRENGGHGIQHDEALQELSDYWRIDKTRIRITVEVPNAHVTRYTTWARSQGIDKKWLNHIMALKGAHSWFVSTREVHMDDWLEVIDLEVNKLLWIPGPQEQRRLSAKGRV